MLDAIAGLRDEMLYLDHVSKVPHKSSNQCQRNDQRQHNGNALEFKHWHEDPLNESENIGYILLLLHGGNCEAANESDLCYRQVWGRELLRVDLQRSRGLRIVALGFT